MKRPYHILFQIFCKATALVGFLHTVDSDRGLSPGDPRHSAVLSAMTATGSPDILAGMAAQLQQRHDQLAGGAHEAGRSA